MTTVNSTGFHETADVAELIRAEIATWYGSPDPDPEAREKISAASFAEILSRVAERAAGMPSRRAMALEESKNALDDASQVALFTAEHVAFDTDPGHIAGVLRSLARTCESAVTALEAA